MTNSTLEESCAQILQLARNLYSAHISLQQIMNLSGAKNARSNLEAVIKQSTQEIIQLDGKVGTRRDPLGIPCPLITNVDGEIIDYDIGRIESEKFLNNLRQTM